MRLLSFVVLLFSLLGCSDSNISEKTIETVEKQEETMLLKSVQTDYDEALALAKKQNKSLFVLIETEHCQWCKRLKKTTLQDQNISERLASEFVLVVLNRDRDFYPEKFRVKGVPTVYMTNTKEEIYATVVGYRKNPQEYLKWFDYIAIERGL